MCSYQTFLGRQTNPETLVEFFPIVTFNQSTIKSFSWRRCRWCSRSSRVIFPTQRSFLENPERKEGWSAVKCISDITTPSPYISIIEWIEGQNVKRWWCNCWGNHHRHQSVSRKEWWWSWRVSTTCVNNLSYALFAAANQCKQIVIVINTDNKHILDPPSHGRQRAHMFEKVLSSQILGANKTWSFQQLGLQI